MGKKKDKEQQQTSTPQQTNPTPHQQRQGPNVGESSSINIRRVLEKFLESNREVYTFKANLSNRERAVVHIVCRKMGLKSKSQGKGNQRRVSVFKTMKQVGAKRAKERLKYFKFSEEAKVVLQDLFTQYPPDDGLIANTVGSHGGGKRETVQGHCENIFSKPSLSKEGIENKREVLASKMKKATNLRQIVQQRAKLPIAAFKDIIKSTIESNQVVLISGETGCGKTTQVPQFLLDHMWSKGKACKIVCTQPRRISATSVAERIASERGENVGGDVGYKIRLESKGGRHTSIVFCTNGILLRILVSAGRSKRGTSKKHAKMDISNISHIIVDEIHERDRYSDFMLAIIRDMLPSYPHLRLILMSATLDADRFSQYFGGCPIIRVPGFTYPVEAYYLEDVLSILKSASDNHLDSAMLNVPNEDYKLTSEDKDALDEAISLAWSNDEFVPLLDLISSEGSPQVYNYQHSVTGLTPVMVFAGKGRVGDVCMLLSLGVDCLLQAKDGTTALELAERENQQEISDVIKKHIENASSDSLVQQQVLDKYLATIDHELIDVVLIEQLLRKVCTDSKDGAILVFLPGWDDIKRTRERLIANPFFNNTSRFLIISLHSMVPSMEQRKVFNRPPVGCRKIILSTNIAETAITIDDVVYVIDSGRMKEKSYDPYNNVSTLQSSWVSKASAKQREGRAGRCQPGTCYHLFSKLRAASLPEFQVPEIKRMPIEELCLQVKLLDPDCKIEDFLLKTLDPPVFESIRNAISVLQLIGALSQEESLTELGEKLGYLPVHPLTSKMLFFAILMNCLDPALTLACASDFRDPFTISMLPNEKKRAIAAKYELASLYGGRSDQFAVVAAFECWKRAKERGLEAQFCSQYFVSPSTMSMLDGMRKQLQMELIRHGLIPNDVSHCSLNARDPGILDAVLVSGLYPMMGRLLPPKDGKRSVVETASGPKVRLHPHSLNFRLTFNKCYDFPLIMYDEITRGDAGMYIKNCSVVGPLPLLLLATEIVVASAKDEEEEEEEEEADECDDGSSNGGGDDSDECKMDRDDTLLGQTGDKILSSPDNPVKVVVDHWLSFASTALDLAQIYCLRERISAAILFKVTHPHEQPPPVLEVSTLAIAYVLSYDGLSGVSLPRESVESLTSILHATEINSSKQEMSKGMGLEFLVSLMTDDKCQNSPQRRKARILSSGGIAMVNDPSSSNSQLLGTSFGTNSSLGPPSQVPTIVGYNPDGNGRCNRRKQPPRQRPLKNWTKITKQ
ncbi:ATP-dependent RNA helicase DHX36-like isoform X1 [Tripterygium wilfordii]|uniref:ATP-dependent RNA helicase DHX36-like isoform X1 n=2 Tax=Tripterygium wilfordii TaxID=458696 RepID=A0A7J7DCK8_TRIWF|nr:ATP-dependent RNA helicase DHX36-like isoform X1 [Tripterygium wilfordii]